MPTAVEIPQKVRGLVERFHEHRDQYLDPSYNETQLRREFVDPFFKALGWDIDNNQGRAEAYKQVVHEDSIKVAGSSNLKPKYRKMIKELLGVSGTKQI